MLQALDAQVMQALAAEWRAAERRLMAVPFRIGVMQLTMEPLDEMLASARAMDEAGSTRSGSPRRIPWWRKHGMEARSSTVVSALMARETTRLTIGWGIISPFTRHPVQVAMDARVVQEAAGPGRFILGFGTSKIFLNNAAMQTSKTLGPMRDAVEIVRGVLGGEAFEYTGSTWNANVPALQDEAHTPRDVPPVYVAATAPKMQALAGEIADGCLTPSITTPPFVSYTRDNVGADIDIGCTVVASIHETDRDRRPRRRARDRRHVPREQGAEHPGLAPTRCSTSPASSRTRSARSPRRWSGAAGSPRRRRCRTRCSTSASRSPARPRTASPRSRSTRRRLHARDARALGREPARADPPLRRARAAAHPVSADEDRQDRPRSARRHGGRDDRRAQLHRRRAGDGRADGRALRGSWACGCSGSRSRRGARTRSAPGRGTGGGQVADVQRAHGHLVLRPRAVAARTCRASSRRPSSATGVSTASASRT